MAPEPSPPAHGSLKHVFPRKLACYPQNTSVPRIVAPCQYTAVRLTRVVKIPRFFTGSKHSIPALKADGGDVEFLRFIEEGGVVELRLPGACEDCPILMRTLKEGIERRLKSGVPGIREVQAV